MFLRKVIGQKTHQNWYGSEAVIEMALNLSGMAVTEEEHPLGRWEP